MNSEQTKLSSIDQYIANFPDEIQTLLQQVRATVRAAAPDAEETISYQIPTFKLKGTYVVYFAAHKNHIGLYPTPTGIEEFRKELAPYQSGKGSARFPYNQSIPFDLITRIVNFRVQEILAKAEAKRKKMQNVSQQMNANGREPGR